ncbi:MAG TPA: tRNA lysidine(34) synthetase TilS [Rhizomicrobium sp.]|jgi:tRNA(Ile)-lysidine synthase|nr:tRNA lysidine(34) synthetase TilS [Rhizomicrobium sp.]
MEAVERLGASWPAAAAVSGGGDSLALLLLLEEWARGGSRPAPIVLIVDHRLKPHSGRDALKVASGAVARGLEAHVLSWRGRKPAANIESSAREARYRLMGDWCQANGIACLFVAHSINDQAETFVLRLSRGSGVDGLAAMAPVSPFPLPGFEELRVARPLLGESRSRLRAFLKLRGETWLEDEMNSDPRFARARLRAAWPALEQLGLSATRVAAAARHLARARTALDLDAEELLARASRKMGEYVLADAVRLGGAAEEIGLRSLARLLMQVSGRHQRPRFESLESLFAAIRSGALGGGRTLHGCRIGRAPKRRALFGPDTLLISREAKRARGPGGERN